MRPFTRSAGWVLMVVLFQLVLIESGFACVIPATGSDSAAMAGMQMAGMDMSGGTGRSSPAQSEHEPAPCQFPWAPAGCQAMTPCAPSALTVASASIPRFTPAPVALPQLVMLAPPLRARAPELPPPRA